MRVAGEAGRAGLGEPAPGQPLDVRQHDVLGEPVQAAVAHAVQRAGAWLEGRAERSGVAAGRRQGHDADAGECGPGGGGPEGEGKGTEEHGVDHDAVGGEVRQDGAQASALAGQRPDEDPSQVVLHPAHAAPGRRFALGVDHHQVVRVVLGGKRDEGRSGRLHLLSIVRRGEEGDGVVLGDEPPGQRQQGRRVALGRCGAQHVAPALHRPGGHRAMTAPLQAGRVNPPSTLDPSKAASVLTVTTPGTSLNVTDASLMFSTTVVPSPRA